MSLLELDEVTIKFGGLTALDRFSLSVNEGTIHALIGPNGAGKSTAFNAITRVYNLTGGQVRFAGSPISTLPPHALAGLGIARTFQNIELCGRMTVLENLQVGASLGGDGTRKKRNLDTVTELFPVLGRKLSMAARNLSGGEQQMLAVGRALMASPRFLLLDEPSIGLAPLVEEQLMASIRQVSNELGLGVLLVEQNAMLALENSYWAYVIELGRITKSAASADLVEDPSIVDAYLGG